MRRLKIGILLTSIALFSILIVSCGQRGNSISSEAIGGNQDTLTKYPILPDAPLITPREADSVNPIHTGHIRGWENRMKQMYADTLQRILKTLIMEDLVCASETAEPLRNDYYPQKAPVLLNVKWKDPRYEPMIYWSTHAMDSIVPIVTYMTSLSSQFDCRFGLQDSKDILRASSPIEILDTNSFKPVIRIEDPVVARVYSPLFECSFRGRPFLISTFDLDLLKATPGGNYMWNIIRNYTYSDYFRYTMPHIVKEVSSDTWYNTLLPGWMTD